MTKFSPSVGGPVFFWTGHFIYYMSKISHGSVVYTDLVELLFVNDSLSSVHGIMLTGLRMMC